MSCGCAISSSMSLYRATPSARRELLWPRWFVELACLADPKELSLLIGKTWFVAAPAIFTYSFGLLIGSIATVVSYLLLVSILKYLSQGYYLPASWIFWKETVANKDVVVTGVTSGLGKETVLNLIEWNASRICLVSRDAHRLEEALLEFKAYASKMRSPTTFVSVQLDLSEISSIPAACEKILTSMPKIDLVIANAGMMNTKGYEILPNFSTPEWTTNHLGTYAFCNGLMSGLRAAGSEAKPSRLIVLGSLAHLWPNRSLYNGERWTPKTLRSYITDLPKEAYNDRISYGFTKMCNMMYAQAMHRRFYSAGEKRVQILSVHPGSVKTSISKKNGAAPSLYKQMIRFLTYKDVRSGIQTTMFCASAPSEYLVSGDFYAECSRCFMHPTVFDIDVQDELLGLSDKMLEKAGVSQSYRSTSWNAGSMEHESSTKAENSPQATD